LIRFPQRGRSLTNISFTPSRGEATHILGPNGAGKTTLIRRLLYADKAGHSMTRPSQTCRL
jgi:ABC-type Mn2+/Zn2+ transport system ATPase subunit